LTTTPSFTSTAALVGPSTDSSPVSPWSRLDKRDGLFFEVGEAIVSVYARTEFLSRERE
jgi:hypothetical protein